MSQPRIEHLDRPFGFQESRPRLSWKVHDVDPGWVQRAYEVERTSGAGNRESVVIPGDDQVLVDWPFAPLNSRDAGTIRVRVSDGIMWSDFGEAVAYEVGLLHTTDWTARWISPTGIGRIDSPAPTLGTTIRLDAAVDQARLYISACGLYEVLLNGQRITSDRLTPGWTAYQYRTRYQTYDVSELLVIGDNSLSVALGNGWYRGYLGFVGQRAFYGDELALIAQLEVTNVGGATRTFQSDVTWAAWESTTISDDLYNGQTIDLRPAEGTPDLHPVKIVDHATELVGPEGPPVREIQTREPIVISSPSSTRHILDFGQNLVGVVRLAPEASETYREIVVRHAEVLTRSGELDTRPLRTAHATDRYLLDENSQIDVIEPNFTFHGFRYAEIAGVTRAEAESALAVVIGSDLRSTGTLKTGDPLVDRLHENIRWGMRGNFLEVPTDCPQRDERLGWTGDIQVFAPTAAFLADSAGFLGSWLRDLSLEQLPDGTVPNVIPNVLTHEESGVAAWGDAACIVPWALYMHYGDRGLLERQLPSMTRWVANVRTRLNQEGLWADGFQFGDWLDPSAPPDDPFAAKISPDVFATACYLRSVDVLSKAARELGFDHSAQEHRELFEDGRRAFLAAYVDESGRIASDCQTAYAIALTWGLLDTTKRRQGAAQRLAELVIESGYAVDTGFIGTAFILDALTDIGRTDLAEAMLLRRELPSWLYPVTMGATTIWERWDSMLPDGTVNPGDMTSFNHYALGAVGDWMHRRLGGIEPRSAGYRTVTVAPAFLSALHGAHATLESPYGLISVKWERNGSTISAAVDVPAGVTAHVSVPWSAEPLAVRGSFSWSQEAGATGL